MRGPNVSYQISLPNLFTIAAKITFGRLALKTVAFNVPQKMPNKTFKQNQQTEQENLLTILGLIRRVWGSFACDTVSRAGAPNSLFVRFDPNQPQKAALQGQPSTVKLGSAWTWTEEAVSEK